MLNNKSAKEEQLKSKVPQDSSSSLSKFVERPLPTEQEVSSFEKVVGREIREEEIENNLSAIYRDQEGNLVDVTNQNFKKKKSWLLTIFKNLFLLAILASAVYLIYYYFINQESRSTGLDLQIIAPEKIRAGEEFDYIIEYRNSSNVAISQINLELVFPNNFFLTEKSVDSVNNNTWNLADLDPGESAQLLLRGRLFGRLDSPNVLTARLTYVPSNISSQFVREASSNTLIDNLGFVTAINYSNNTLVGQESEISLSFYDFANINFDDLILVINSPENFNITSVSLKEASQGTESQLEKITNERWRLTNLFVDNQRFDLVIKFKVSEKITDQAELSLDLFNKDLVGQERLIWDKKLNFEVMQSDLSLSLSLNDNKGDQAVNFGQTLNYSLSYNNYGQAILRDVVVMAVLEGEMVDWSSFSSSLGGTVMDGVIVWTKEEIPALAELLSERGGEINFSVKVKNFQEKDLGRDLSINSWAQFSFGLGSSDLEDNRSNLIVSLINSDLNLSEKIRYFDDNNVPVGSGPLPPKVGETSSFRVYWTVKNTLHELSGTEVILNLPNYINWDGRAQTNIGEITYLADSQQVIWEIGRLPLSIYRADAEFNLSLTPTENDRDKILVISPGATIKATDIVTQGELQVKAGPTTSKLEDDEIAALSNNGRVE